MSLFHLLAQMNPWKFLCYKAIQFNRNDAVFTTLSHMKRALVIRKWICQLHGIKLPFFKTTL